MTIGFTFCKNYCSRLKQAYGIYWGLTEAGYIENDFLKAEDIYFLLQVLCIIILQYSAVLG